MRVWLMRPARALTFIMPSIGPWRLLGIGMILAALGLGVYFGMAPYEVGPLETMALTDAAHPSGDVRVRSETRRGWMWDEEAFLSATPLILTLLMSGAAIVFVVGYRARRRPSGRPPPLVRIPVRHPKSPPAEANSGRRLWRGADIRPRCCARSGKRPLSRECSRLDPNVNELLHESFSYRWVSLPPLKPKQGWRAAGGNPSKRTSDLGYRDRGPMQKLSALDWNGCPL